MAEFTEFHPPRDISWNSPDVGIVNYGPGDAGMVVMFYNYSKHNAHKSAQEGRPIFEDHVYVKISPPGERLNIVDRPATDEDRRRWNMQWQMFQQNKQQVPAGTPIGLLYPDQPSIADMLRAHRVHTVEQLSELSSNAIDTIGMGAQRYVNDARKYLDQAGKGVHAIEFRKTVERLESEKRVLEQQMQALRATVQGMQSNMAQGPANLAQLQQLLAGVMQVPMQAPQIDGQSQMIANNHPTREIAQEVKKPKRKRVTINR